jgi:hypothetical protein
MSVVMFTGPTLSAADARMVLDADYRPPAAEGDVYRAARGRPQVIGIIDGYFERVPSVWHKEILWAMSQGIHVFGAASMGALRAAELDAFGMEGIGAIFEAYRDGSLEDDDEVAVAHAGPEFGFMAASEAMVDIRFTLGRALDAGVISAETYAALESTAKALFYPDRNYPLIIERAAGRGVAGDELQRFRAWLPAGRTSLKRADAEAMLCRIRDRLAAGLEPKSVRYAFENTSMWESAWRLAGDADQTDPVQLDAILEELRLEGERFLDTQQAAMLRCLAIKHSYVQGLGETDGQVATAATRFWRAHHVGGKDAKENWLRANDVDELRMSGLLDDEARVAWVKSLASLDARGYIIDQLRVSGDYPRLVARARDKQRWLAARGIEEAGAADAGLGIEDLVRWYFEDRLGRKVPDDLSDYCRTYGIESRAALERALGREFCYLNGSTVRAGTEG